MKKMINYLGVILLISIFIPACTVALKTSEVIRPVEKIQSSWETIGSVRIEVVSINDNTIPYDKLLAKAHEKYGEGVDVIEIKKEKIPLSASEKKALYKEEKISYTHRSIYNAIVIKYLPIVKNDK